MAYRSYHPDTVTRYVTQVKNNGSKIVAFFCELSGSRVSISFAGILCSSAARVFKARFKAGGFCRFPSLLLPVGDDLPRCRDTLHRLAVHGP
jgi:hypothetical protein